MTALGVFWNGVRRQSLSVARVESLSFFDLRHDDAILLGHKAAACVIMATHSVAKVAIESPAITGFDIY